MKPAGTINEEASGRLAEQGNESAQDRSVRAGVNRKHKQPSVGVCQWFHYWDEPAIEKTLACLAELGCTRLRTGISWADFHRPQGREWYRRQMSLLAAAGLDVLVSVWHTPPSLSESGSCSGPPRCVDDYVGFVWEVIQEYGDCFNSIEIWNEPNNRIKWNFVDHDPDWSKFARLLAGGAREARRQGKQTVLGGIIPVDPNWLDRMANCGALDDLDVLAFHAFPGMWWLDHPNWDLASHWHGWEKKVELLERFAKEREVWVTETGLSTWDVHNGQESRFDEQQRRLVEALSAPVDRIYWYSLIDLAAERPCIEMTEDCRMEVNEYHMGLVSQGGQRKPAFHALKAALRQEAAAAARAAAAR